MSTTEIILTIITLAVMSFTTVGLFMLAEMWAKKSRKK